ncbi:MAG: hypothetical protein ACREVM_05005 [Burkholderiales bacterium]
MRRLRCGRSGVLAAPLGTLAFFGAFLDELLALLADQILSIGLPLAIGPQGFLLAAAALVVIVVIVRDRGHGQQECR